MNKNEELDQRRLYDEVLKIMGTKGTSKFADDLTKTIPVSAKALGPLSKIDFEKLIEINDYEESFLRRHFYLGLAEAFAGRIKDGSSNHKITRADVRNAMIAVGSAARAAPEESLKTSNRDLVISICPYCV